MNQNESIRSEPWPQYLCLFESYQSQNLSNGQLLLLEPQENVRNRTWDDLAGDEILGIRL